MNLKGKKALITGGGTGLGREIALQLAKEGVDMVLNYSTSAEETEKTAAEIAAGAAAGAGAAGVKAFALKADVSIVEETEKLVEKSAELLGGLDILINNAGTTKFVRFQDLDGLNPDDFSRLYETNVMSIFFASRAAAKIMKKSGGGHIINTVSTAGLTPAGSSIAYAVSKAAGIHMTKCLALALAPEIKVNAVAPGLMMTRWVSGFSAEHIQAAKQKTLLNKTVGVEECASMFLSIARNDSMTGEIIKVDCGQVL
ncbi:MAG: SDR family oxidoreductase [Spirochaetes bacterium]|nr:SDR family oxidoreductase [Spirochaetota bacterium]